MSETRSRKLIDHLLTAIGNNDQADIQTLGRRLAACWAAGDFYLGTS